MRVDTPRAELRVSRDRRGDLRVLLQDERSRPCPGCDAACPDAAHPPTCTCGCSASCARAPRQLSVEPDQFPLELRVVPVVYELLASGLSQPCWSCEGHDDARGHLFKWPQVWFYSNSTTYLDLLRTTLANLHYTEQTSRAWQVVRSEWQPDSVIPMYELRACEGGPEPSLARLQGDLGTLSRAVGSDLRVLARNG